MTNQLQIKPMNFTVGNFSWFVNHKLNIELKNGPKILIMNLQIKSRKFLLDFINGSGSARTEPKSAPSPRGILV